MSASDEVTFAISLDTPDRLDVKYIADTLRDVESLLGDIEKRIRGTEKAEVHWAWQQEPSLEFVAMVNGVNREDLQRIVDEAESGFRQAKFNKDDPEQPIAHWPKSFGTVAKNRVRSILKRLDRVESITVRVTGRTPVIIDAAQVGEQFVGRIKQTMKRSYASVEGRLDLIAHRGKFRAAIQEVSNPQNSISCTFDDAMADKIKNLFDKRVIAEGLVRFRENGSPISITQIKSIRERTSGRSLEDFIGTAPSLTGGEDEDEFMGRMRNDG